MSTKYTLLPSLCRVIPNPLSKPPDDIKQDTSSKPEIINTIKEEENLHVKASSTADEEERELGLSDMTETEASASEGEDESKLVIADDSSSKVHISSRLLSKDLDSTRVRSLEETMKFLQGNTSMKSNASSHSQDLDMGVDSEGDGEEEDYDDESDGEIVVSSTGAPDKYGFLTEIYVPKMRGFEDLSDRCILDSVSINLTLDQVVRSNMDQFNHYMRNPELTDTQKEITKYVRRRARNRVSARKSRMKKISDIVRLSQEIKVIRQKKESLKNERLIMDKLKLSWEKRVAILEDFILEHLREHGEKKDIMLVYNDNDITVVKDEDYEEKMKMKEEKQRMLEEAMKLEEERKKQSLLQPAKVNPKAIVIKKVQLVKSQFSKNNKRTLLVVQNNKDDAQSNNKPQESLLNENMDFGNDLQDYLVSKLQDTQAKLNESLLNNVPESEKNQPCQESTQNEIGNYLENKNYVSVAGEKTLTKGLNIPAQEIDQKKVQEGFKIKIQGSNKDKSQQYLQSIISENLQSNVSKDVQPSSESVQPRPPKISLLKNSKMSLIKIQKNTKTNFNNVKGSFEKSDLKILEDNPELKTLLLNRNKNMIDQKNLLVTKRPFTLSANKEYFDNKKVKISTPIPDITFKGNEKKIITNKFINVCGEEKIEEPVKSLLCSDKGKLKPRKLLVRNVVSNMERTTNQNMLGNSNSSIGSEVIHKNEVAKSNIEHKDNITNSVLGAVSPKGFNERVILNNKKPGITVRSIIIKKDNREVVAKNRILKSLDRLESKLISESMIVKNKESMALEKSMIDNNEEPNSSGENMDVKNEEFQVFDDKTVVKNEELKMTPENMVVDSEEPEISKNINPEIPAGSLIKNNHAPTISAESIKLEVEDPELNSTCIVNNEECKDILESKIVESKLLEDSAGSIVINANHKESEVTPEEPKVIVESIFGNNVEHKRSVDKINFSIEDSKFLEDNLIQNIVDETMDIGEEVV